jgi:hypothetical protein
LTGELLDGGGITIGEEVLVILLAIGSLGTRSGVSRRQRSATAPSERQRARPRDRGAPQRMQMPQPPALGVCASGDQNQLSVHRRNA